MFSLCVLAANACARVLFDLVHYKDLVKPQNRSIAKFEIILLPTAFELSFQRFLYVFPPCFI